MSGCYYLAYGSNMDPARIRSRLGRHLLDEDISPSAIAVLPENKVVFRKRLSNANAAADLAPRLNGDAAPPAEAVIWRITETGLSQLDVFEGVGAGHYRREPWTVLTTGGKSIKATVYLAETDVIEYGLRPEVQYLQHLLNGADLFLSGGYANWLRTIKTAEVLHE